MGYMENIFDRIHLEPYEGWGFSFRRSQLFRYYKYIDILSKFNVSGKALEIGCSTGFFSRNYLYPIFNINLIATDISYVAIKKARRLAREINFCVACLPFIGFPENEFDLVTITEVLSYLDMENREKSIVELYRIVKRDGYILISVNLGQSPYFSIEEIRTLIEKKFKIVHEDGLYLKSYHKYIESPLWMILVLLGSTEQIRIMAEDSIPKKIVKKFINITIRQKVTFFTLSALLRIFIKFILYIMPIRCIDIVSRIISPKQQSVYIALAKNQN
jgi:ubiquinone/menaquinone biosynthesis C-methylase UbiE